MSIRDELMDEHKECLADEALREQAKQALPLAKERYDRARGNADYHAADTAAAGGSESHWTNSGGEDAYVGELVSRRHYELLKAFVEGQTELGSVGYFIRDDLTKAITKTTA
jgi:hypothetical protein